MGTLSQSLGSTRSLIAIALLFLIISPLWAQKLNEDPERGLNLTQEQKIKIEEIRKKFRDELNSQTEEYLKKKLELLNEKRAPDPDPKKIRRLEEEIEVLRVKREATIRRYLDEIESILSPDQRSILFDYQGSEKRKMRNVPKRWRREWR